MVIIAVVWGPKCRCFCRSCLLYTSTVQNLKWVFPSFSLTVSAREPRQGRRRRAALAAPRPILDAPVYVPYIPHRSAVTQHVELTFPRRGRYSQDLSLIHI